MSDPRPLVVGIDPSLIATGVATNDGVCLTVGRDGITVMPLIHRVTEVDLLVAELSAYLLGADLVVIESKKFASKFSAGQLERDGLNWLLLRTLVHAGIPVAEVAPTCRMRYATGKGQAAKTVIVDAVARRLPMFDTKGNDNAADAAVFAAMGADHLGHPMAVMPATHRAALASVEWPPVDRWEAAQ